MHLSDVFFKVAMRSFCLALFIAAAAVLPSAHATAVMELRIEELLLHPGDLRSSLLLNANQSALWNQVEEKSRALVRVQQQRRKQLQKEFLDGLADPQAEVRNLFGLVDREEAAGSQEDNKLRELFLLFADALDDKQRGVLNLFLRDRLQRSDAPGRDEPREGGGGPGHKRGGPRGGAGMGGGMGGPGGDR